MFASSRNARDASTPRLITYLSIPLPFHSYHLPLRLFSKQLKSWDIFKFPREIIIVRLGSIPIISHEISLPTIAQYPLTRLEESIVNKSISLELEPKQLYDLSKHLPSAFRSYLHSRIDRYARARAGCLDLSDTIQQ